MHWLIVILIISISFTGNAQSQAAPKRKKAVPTNSTPSKDAKSASDLAHEHVMQLLEQAEAGSRSLDPISRAFTLIQVARAYQSSDKKKTEELLESAIASANLGAQEKPEESYHARGLKQEALKVMIAFDPAGADAMLEQLKPEERQDVLYALLDYYQREKKLDHAIEQIVNIAQQAEAPYGFTSRLMDVLPSEQHAEKPRLITLCLSSFSDHPHPWPSYGERDFGELLLKFHKELPAAMVAQAIDALFKDAEEIDKKNADTSPETVSFASAGGAARVASTYQYRLFQLLPLLRSVDPDRAERILREQSDLQTLLQKYPGGLASLAVEGKRPSLGFTLRGASSGGSGALAGGGSPLEAQKAATILQDADAHPQDALANVLMLKNASIKTDALISIARASREKNATVAEQALKKAMDSAEEMRSEQAVLAMDQIARLFLRMGQNANASTVVERGMKLSGRLFKEDTNPDDPNSAPKIYWPSTAGWRAMLSIASSISPLWTADLLREIPDEECRTLAQLGVATSLLKIGRKEVEIDNWKKGMSMSFYKTIE